MKTDIEVSTRLMMVIDAVKKGYIPNYTASHSGYDVWMMIDDDEVAFHHGQFRNAITMKDIVVEDNGCDAVIIGNALYGRIVIPYEVLELLV